MSFLHPGRSSCLHKHTSVQVCWSCEVECSAAALCAYCSANDSCSAALLKRPVSSVPAVTTLHACMHLVACVWRDRGSPPSMQVLQRFLLGFCVHVNSQGQTGESSDSQEQLCPLWTFCTVWKVPELERMVQRVQTAAVDGYSLVNRQLESGTQLVCCLYAFRGSVTCKVAKNEQKRMLHAGTGCLSSSEQATYTYDLLRPDAWAACLV